MIVVLLLLLAAGVWLMAVAVRRASTGRAWSARTTAALADAALVWTVLAAAALAFAPLGTTETVSVATSGTSLTGTPVTETTSMVTHESLVESEGAGVLVALLIPVAVALAGALARGRMARQVRIGAGSALLAFCLLGAASIGAFYLPAPVLLLVAGVKTRAGGPEPRSAAATNRR